MLLYIFQLLFSFFHYTFSAYKAKPVQEFNSSINSKAAWNKEHAVVPEYLSHG